MKAANGSEIGHQVRRKGKQDSQLSKRGVFRDECCAGTIHFSEIRESKVDVVTHTRITNVTSSDETNSGIIDFPNNITIDYLII